MQLKVIIIQISSIVCLMSFSAKGKRLISLQQNTSSQQATNTGMQMEAGPMKASPQKKEQEEPIEYYAETEKNGLRGFYAKKGDLLLEYALTHRVRYARLLEWNNLPDAPLEENMFIYLGKKRRTGLVPQYTVEQGMTMHLISQEVGVDLASLLFYNKLGADEQPVPGTILNLQGPAGEKPEVYTLSKVSRKPVERTLSKDEGYIYKKDIEQGSYTSQDEQGSYRMEEETQETPLRSGDAMLRTSGEESNISEAAKNLAAEPGGDAWEDSDEEPSQQKLSRKEKKQQKKAEKEAEDMTPLEKLKLHMDRNVYGDPKSDWREAEKKTKETQQDTEQVRSQQDTEQLTTFPARKTTEEEQDAGSAYHTVKAGDTAFSISKKYGISLNQLKAWNDLPASMTVKKGQRLKVAP